LSHQVLRFIDAERTLDALHGGGRGRAVEADRIGDCDGVGIGVVEIKPLPQPLRPKSQR
jgi:hypothetical protein